MVMYRRTVQDGRETVKITMAKRSAPEAQRNDNGASILRVTVHNSDDVKSGDGKQQTDEQVTIPQCRCASTECIEYREKLREYLFETRNDDGSVGDGEHDRARCVYKRLAKVLSRDSVITTEVLSHDSVVTTEFLSQDSVIMTETSTVTDDKLPSPIIKKPWSAVEPSTDVDESSSVSEQPPSIIYEPSSVVDEPSSISEQPLSVGVESTTNDVVSILEPDTDGGEKEAVVRLRNDELYDGDVAGVNGSSPQPSRPSSGREESSGTFDNVGERHALPCQAGGEFGECGDTRTRLAAVGADRKQRSYIQFFDKFWHKNKKRNKTMEALHGNTTSLGCRLTSTGKQKTKIKQNSKAGNLNRF